MSKLKSIVDQALIKLGPEHVAAMCNVHGSTDGSWQDVPAERHDELAGVLSRMTRNGQAVAQAKADLTVVKESGHLTGTKAARPNVNAHGFELPESAPAAAAESKSSLSWDEIRNAAFAKMANPPKDARLGKDD